MALRAVECKLCNEVFHAPATQAHPYVHHLNERHTKEEVTRYISGCETPNERIDHKRKKKETVMNNEKKRNIYDKIRSPRISRVDGGCRSCNYPSRAGSTKGQDTTYDYKRGFYFYTTRLYQQLFSKNFWCWPCYKFGKC